MNMKKIFYAVLAALVFAGCSQQPVTPTEIEAFDYESNVGVKGKVFYGEKPAASGVTVTVTMLSPESKEDKVQTKADGSFTVFYRLIADNGADFMVTAEIENEYIGHWKSDPKTVHADKEEMAEVEIVMSEVAAEEPSEDPSEDTSEDPETTSDDPESTDE